MKINRTDNVEIIDGAYKGNKGIAGFVFTNEVKVEYYTSKKVLFGLINLRDYHHEYIPLKYLKKVV